MLKKLCVTVTIAAFFLILANGMQAQKLDQTALMKQFLGKWQSNAVMDTAEIWDFQQDGNSFKAVASYLVKGNKTPLRTGSTSFNAEMGKYKGTELYPDGRKDTWLGSFTSDKKFCLDFVKDFNAEIVFFKIEIVFDSPSSFTMTGFTKDGAKTWENRYNKIN